MNKNKIDKEKRRTVRSFPAKRFCGEGSSFENCRCKERFDRELIVNTNYHSYTILALKERTSFPVIEPILKKNEFR
jgi:hypothetical protein